MNVTQWTIPATGTGVENLVGTITSDVGTMLPVGVGIMAIFLGVTVIPRIIYKFF